MPIESTNTFSLGTDRAYGVLGSGEAGVITNGGGGTVYVGAGPSTSAGSYTYAIATGTAQVVNGPASIIASANGPVSVRKVGVPIRSAAPTTQYWIGGAAQGSLATGTRGTSGAWVAGTIEFGEVSIRERCTLTGVKYLIGGTGGTNSVIGVLYDVFGKPLAWSAIAGTTAGTQSTLQSLAFISPYEVLTPGRYIIGVAGDGTTATVQRQSASVGIQGTTSVFGGTMASGWPTAAAPIAITVATAVGAVPVAGTY